MPTSFNSAACAQRNRLAARRDGVNAAPLHLLRAAPDAAPSALLYAHGTLPATPAAAVERINALLPPDAPPLTEDAVYLHYAEAANNNFIGDRCMFLDGTTLRNIALDAQAGIAFMNSHRTGGLSAPADLPFGKTFAGRFEQDHAGGQRALVGFYMLRATAPNGAQGPTTDDLHAQIVGGTLADVSVGLFGGSKLCDVCGQDVSATTATGDSLCPHVPGTTREMDAPAQAAQTARGVVGGRASYTLLDAHMGEISAVYDGAVPGAGFRKALRLARSHHLTAAELLEARQTYAALTTQGDFPMDDITEAIETAFRRMGLGQRDSARAQAPPAPLPEPMPTPPPLPPPDPQVATLTAQVQSLEAAAAATAAQFAADAQAGREREAATFAAALTAAGRTPPALQARVAALYAQALAFEAAAPAAVTFAVAPGQLTTATFAETLAGLLREWPVDARFSEQADAQSLDPTGVWAAAAATTPTPERLATLASMTPLGRTAQAHTNGKG